MATLVDVIGLFKAIGLYETVFPGILIFALVYGLLSKFKPFGESKGVNGIIALIVALIFISFTKAVAFMSYFIPLLTGLFVVLLLVLLIFMFMGVPGETITEAMSEPAAYGLIIVLIVIFAFVAIASAFPELAAQEGAPPTPGAPGADVWAKYTAVLFHPVLLGLIVLLAVFAVATYFITREKKE